MAVDVELKCNGCGNETIATDGYWMHKCFHCGGTREVTKRHDHVLTLKETQELGFTIQSMVV